MDDRFAALFDEWLDTVRQELERAALPRLDELQLELNDYERRLQRIESSVRSLHHTLGAMDRSAFVKAMAEAVPTLLDEGRRMAEGISSALTARVEALEARIAELEEDSDAD